MAYMAWASGGFQVTCGAAMQKLAINPLSLQCQTITHMLSPHAPREGSYKPPGMGCRRVSNVRGFSIFLTERSLISVAVRKPKSTLPMADGTG